MIKSDFRQAMPENPRIVHFVGIGGAGMSGIAQLFLAAGISVTGSDIRNTDTVKSLRVAGATVAIGHSATNIGGADAMVVTGAIAEDNVEYLAAKQNGIPIVHRARALAWLTANHRVVAVAGAHGKTTSTAMVVTALRSLGGDPSFVNGGVIRSLGVSALPGSGPVFVVEADESDGSFLLYDTAIALVTNVDPDHLDHFGSEEAFKEAFIKFATAASEQVVISADDPGAREITSRLNVEKVTTFGEASGADIRLHSVHLGATVSFRLAYHGVDYPATLRVPGLHNALNAAGAFGVVVGLGFDPSDTLKAISEFDGTGRRFEFRGEVRGVRVFDEFAHHPTEVQAALRGARAIVGSGRLIPIFQPHLYSRTRMLAGEFAEAFEELADFTIVVPIYGARQEPEPGVTGRLITERFRQPERARYFEDWASAVDYAAEIAGPGDLLMSMGGGDIYLMIPELLAALETDEDKQP